MAGFIADHSCRHFTKASLFEGGQAPGALICLHRRELPELSGTCCSIRDQRERLDDVPVLFMTKSRDSEADIVRKHRRRGGRLHGKARSRDTSRHTNRRIGRRSLQKANEQVLEHDYD